MSPETEITSDVWYKYRPTLERMAGGATFDLPRNQIYLLTFDKEVYGKPIGKALQGAVKDGKRKLIFGGIQFKGLFDKRSVIYVFPKFIGPGGEKLPVRPAKLHPPGAYRRDLYVEIGVEDPEGKAVQYIKNLTDRKLGRDQEADN